MKPIVHSWIIFVLLTTCFASTSFSQCQPGDLAAPSFTAPALISSETNSYPQPAISASDSSGYTITATTHVDFSEIDSLHTPDLGQNLCNYVTSAALMLFAYPNMYRYWTVSNGVFEDMPDGTAHFTGVFTNYFNPNGQLHADVSLLNKKNWEEWTSGASFSDYKADCEGIGSEHPNWFYYILSSNSTLTGQGDYEGSLLTLTHAPVNEVYGYQLGLGANNYSPEYGSGGWFTVQGTLNDSSNNQTLTNPSAGDFMFRHEYANYEAVITTTYTLEDDCGNQSVFNQQVEMVPNPGAVLGNMPITGTMMELCDFLQWQPQWYSHCGGELATYIDILPTEQITSTPSLVTVTVASSDECGVSNSYTFDIMVYSDGGCDAIACAADFNDDGVISSMDIMLFMSGFNTDNNQFDTNSDGQVNMMDLFVVLENFGSLCGE